MDAARLQVVIGSDTVQAEAGLERVNALVQGYGQRLSGLAAGISFAVANQAIQGLQAALGAAGGAVLTFNGQLEQAQIGFTNLLGSGEKAAAFLQQLRDFAATTPFEFPQLLQASRLLTGLGVQAESVIPLMTDIGNALASMGQISEGAVNQATLAIGQMIARTKVSAQEMNQLANVGIQGWKILAEATGLPIAKLQELSEQGKISSDTFINAFHKVMSEGRIGQFMQEQAQTFLGALSNVQDGFRNLMATSFEPFFKVVRNATVALGNFLVSDQAKAFGADFQATIQQMIDSLAPLGDALQRAFSAGQGGGVGAALQSLVADISAFGQSLFGAGYTMIQSLAQGIVSGADSLISQAAEYVASLIASFLVGQSPPPSGPLSRIDEDGRRLIETYVSAFGDADLSPVEAVAGRIAAVMGDKEGLQAQAAAVADTVDQISDAMRRLQDETNAEQGEIRGIKDTYDPIIDSLQEQIDKINDVNDLLDRQQDIQRELRGLEIDKRVELAKGDPRVRAQIAGARESLKFRKEDLQLQIEALNAGNKKGANDKKIAALRAQMAKINAEDVGYQKQLAGLTDRVALATAARDKTLLDSEQTTARIAKKQSELNRAQQTSPLEQQIKDAKKTEATLIKPHEAAIKLMGDQLDAIKMQQQAYQDLDRTIQKALGQIKTASGAAGGAGGAGGLGKLAGAAGGGLSLPKIDIAAKAQEAGENAGRSLLAGIQTHIQANAPKLVAGALGAALGGAVFGPLGAIAGGLFGARLVEALQQQVPDIGARVAVIAQTISDAFMTVLQVFQGNWTPDPESINPFVEKVGEIALVIRDQVLPVVQGFIEFLKSNWMPIVAGVVAGLAAFSTLSTLAGLVTTITTVFAGLVAVLGGPVTLAIGAIALAVGLLTAAWVSNLGNIQGIVGQVVATIQGLATQAQPILAQVAAIFAEAFAQIQILVQQALDFITILWLDHGVAIMTAITTIWMTIQAILAAFWIVIQIDTMAALAAIAAFWAAHGVEVLAILTAAWELIKATLATFLTLVATAITAALQLIALDWAGAWLTIQTGFAATWVLMKATATAGVTLIQTTLAAAWELIKAAASTAWDAIVKAVLEKWGALKSGMESLNQAITTAVQNLFNSVVSFIQPAIDVLNKLLGAAQSLYDFLSGHTFKFQIEVPSIPSWATPGSPTPFEIGVRGISDALRELGRVSAPTLSSLPSPLAAMPAGATSGGGGVTVNLTVQGALIQADEAKAWVTSAVDDARRSGDLA